ncbi:MAG: T9SS type A sorting domain-containing protein [Candidatus Eisenbacteria sp.]|nr:T9SS type A sorting domain-containing protein [Candidatus Eisenbacteria bacterium]
MRRTTLLMGLGIAVAMAGSSHADSRLIRLDPGASSSSPSFEIFNETKGGFTLLFNLPALESHDVDVDGHTFQQITIPGGEITGNAGPCSMPTITRLIAIPPESGVHLRVVKSVQSVIDGHGLLPVQPAPDVPPVRLGAPAVFRDLRVVPLIFEPVRCDPVRKTLEVTRSLTVEIRFEGGDARNAGRPDRPAIASSFDRIYRSTVLNYKGPGENQRVVNGSYLMICPDDSTVIRMVRPLLEWRTRMGYPSVLIPVADKGPTTYMIIKDLIQDAYDCWENPPEYVVLVGDALYTNLIVRTFFYGPGAQDTHYALLDGDDLLPDVHIGRISVQDTTELEYIIDKIIRYETEPCMDNPDWFLGACLIGDPRHPPSGSGVTCRHVMEWVARGLREVGYTCVDEIYEEHFANRFTESLNRGVSLMAYRGHEPMSGIYNTVILDLDNGEMLPFAVTLTCETGSFAYMGTCAAEAFLRAGSLGSPAGGIGAVGVSTDETYTRTNNVMMYGIFQGLVYEGIAELGAALTRGKINEYLHFGYDEPAFAESAIRKTNLIGDPATRCWTRPPGRMDVAHPDTIAVGTTSVRVGVRDGTTGEPIPGACVCLWKEDEMHVSGLTGGNGLVDLCVNIQTPGSLQITVTSWNCAALCGEIPVRNEDANLVLRNFDILDDGSAAGCGNGDGVANAGETIGIFVHIENRGISTAHHVTVAANTGDPFVVLTGDAGAFGDLPAGETVCGPNGFTAAIAGGCPHGHVIPVALEIHSDEGSWNALLEIPVASARFEIAVRTRLRTGLRVDPAQATEVAIDIRNSGSLDAPDVTGTLISLSQYVTVTTPVGTFGSIPQGRVGSNREDPFEVMVSAECFPGHLAPCLLALETSSGLRDTVAIGLTIGSAGSTDPLGPDEYGYFAFDDTDTAYAQAPVYDWIEIAGDCGGPGRILNLDDDSDYWLGSADHVTVALPFPFAFYGATFDSVTISPDGWIAMGSTGLEDCWNTFLPAPGGPDAMIAPFWEDLYMVAESGVWEYYDEENHRYIIEWSRMQNKSFPGSEQTFEAVLLDPVFHPTSTGDGEILFQYHTVVNEEGQQAYSTVGIENLDHTDGLLYTYFNWYPDGAAELEPGRAIRFVPMPFLLADGSGTAIPATLLHASFPNPFAPLTTIRYDLARPGHVSLGIYDVRGRLVRSLVDSHRETGFHLVQWNGVDDHGRSAAPGLYFCRLVTRDGSWTRKMLLLR